MKTRFRSKYPNYRWDGLEFQNHCAETDNSAVVEKAKKDPSFGTGGDFWIDHVPEMKSKGDGDNSEPVKDKKGK